MESMLRKNSKPARSLLNHQIKSDKVRCIDSNNDNIGVISKSEAISLAMKSELDLVQISNGGNDIPTCKIMDYGKYKYEQSKRDKLRSKKQREAIVKIKEIKFRPCTGEHDLMIKAIRAAKFLSEDCKIKITINFKGRERNNKGIAFEKLKTFIDFVKTSDILKGVDIISLNQPVMDDKSLNMYMIKKM